MSISVSALRSPNTFHKQATRLSSHSPPLDRVRANSIAPSGTPQPRAITLRLREAHRFHGVLLENFGYPAVRNNGFLSRAENDGGGTEREADEVDMESRGQSSMPERFRYLTKEVPEKPLRWPLLIVLALLLYTWRTVWWELSPYIMPVAGVFWWSIQSIGYILRFGFVYVLWVLTHPLFASIRLVETILNTIQDFYSLVINHTPIQELTKGVILASLVLSIAEAAVPGSVNRQPYLLTVAGIIGFVAVRGYISELFFWTLLLGLFSFGRWVKNRDYVSSALPVAAVLAAVGEPWIQALAMVSYLSLAVVQYSRGATDEKEREGASMGMRAPFPLLWAAFAICVRLAAKWTGYRHLTWMVA